MASARSRANRAGSLGSKSAPALGVDGHEQTGLAGDDDLDDSSPTADATTGVPQAIASRLMIPNGS